MSIWEEDEFLSCANTDCCDIGVPLRWTKSYSLRSYVYVGRFLLCSYRNVQYIPTLFSGVFTSGLHGIRRIKMKSCSDVVIVIWNLSLAVGMFFPSGGILYTWLGRLFLFTLCPFGICMRIYAHSRMTTTYMQLNSVNIHGTWKWLPGSKKNYFFLLVIVSLHSYYVLIKIIKSWQNSLFW